MPAATGQCPSTHPKLGIQCVNDEGHKGKHLGNYQNATIYWD